ncbi:MAG: DNA cytosine methyltransferase [Ruminococcus flavefaciens]|nr:DNA cytosine methyltransferase [Ruminococcus flavefaciens]
MKVLVACEESQRVCTAFRELGHEAYSCDIQECSGGHPEWHIQGDVLPLINGKCEFVTLDGITHTIDSRWDLLIAHPPCTYLSNAGAARLYKKINGKSYIELERLNKGFDAKEFFLKFLTASADRIAVENPVPSGVYRLPNYSQIIQPYEYGHPYSKKTCLWLIGLPQLKPTEIVKPICSWVSGGSKKSDGTSRENCGTSFRDSKRKSKTFEGIAKAMAEQWGKEIIKCQNH